MDQTLDCLETLSAGIVGLRSKDADFKEAEETVQHDTVGRVTANPAAKSSDGSQDSTGDFDPVPHTNEDQAREQHPHPGESSSSADGEEPDRWVAQSVPGYDGGRFDEEEESGMRWLLPVEQEILHTHTQTYLLETLLPPSGDFLIKIFLDQEPVMNHWLNCTSSCPGGHTDQCECRCGSGCDCQRCLRSEISHVIRFLGAPLDTGVHQLQALLLASSHSTDADPQVVSSYFHVYEQWLHAFEAPTLPTAQYHTKLLQVSGPRYRLPSHHYNFLPYQATGMGLLWPGITVRRPVPAEVFGSDEEVVLEIELLDYSDTDRLRVWLQVSEPPEFCTGPEGCELSEPVPIEVLPSVLPGAKISAELNCADSECRRRRVSSIVLPPGHYRFLLTLVDRHSRALSGTRTRAFKVDRKEGKELESRVTWECPEVHCGRPTADATDVTDTAKKDARKEEKNKAAAGKGSTAKRVVLLVYEWPPLARFSGDADRARQLIHALSALDFEVHFVSRSCGSWLGDALSKAPYAVGPRLTCGLKTSDIPAYLNEFNRLDLVLLLSTFWYYPTARSFPEVWITHIRDGEWAADVKVVVMADVVTSPNALGINDKSDVAQLHSHGAQLLGFAAADAIALENPEDQPWLQTVLPGLPSFLVRFAATDAPLPPDQVPGFDARQGLIWVGSGHADNIRALEWVVFKVLPLVRKRLHTHPADGTLVVVGGGTDDKASLSGVEGVQVMGHLPDLSQMLGERKVCVTPTVLSSPRFQTKHLQALSRGVPVVTTAKGAAGYRLLTTVNASCDPHVTPETGTTARDCGWPGIDADACTRSGCCFVPGATPACRFPTMAAYAAGQGLLPSSPGLGRLRPIDDSNGNGQNNGAAEHVLDMDEAEAEQFAEAVIALVTDKERWELESKGALQRVTDHFQQKHVDQEVREMAAALLP